MDFQALSFIFNRALCFTFSKKKFWLIFSILALSGLLVVFFRGMALHAGHWVHLSMTFIPIFICTGILLSMGILLIRIYHDEVKKGEAHYWRIMSRSWEIVIGASYFAIPIIFGYLLLWMVMGIFFLLREIPLMGDFFSAVLSFAPFVIMLVTLFLCVISLGLLFFAAPLIALKGLERGAVFHIAMDRLEKDPFANFILLLIALLPCGLVFALLMLAAVLTGNIFPDTENSLQNILKWFFMMLPFTAFFTPAVIFFFNFAAEAQALIQKQLKQR